MPISNSSDRNICSIRNGQNFVADLPCSVSVFAENSVSHLQGIAIDHQREFLYFSFTTCLLKTDLRGNIVGSVSGLPGHLGCIAFHPQEDRVYGSLEFKHDTIGSDILRGMCYGSDVLDGFYIASFDVDKITRRNMNPNDDGVMEAVFLKEVYEDFSAPGHRFGCSGIDGITFAPSIGEDCGEYCLYVAYGIYGDTARDDNDHQVILKYGMSRWSSYSRPLNLRNMHRSGPEMPDEKYFVYTGNTTYGIQNLEYDPSSGCMVAAVYTGDKEQFPNYPLFFIDCRKKPKNMLLRGIGEEGFVLSLTDFGSGICDHEISGSWFPLGSMGILSLGSGYFYIADGYKTEKGFGGSLHLYQLDRKHMTFSKI